MVSDGLHSYGYDDRGRLVSVDAGAVTYAHNGEGQRVKKDAAAVTLFAYDEAGRLIGEYDAAGSALKETVWFAGAPVAVLDGGAVHYVHTDHLGTPRAITDGNVVIWRWESDAFGATAAQEDPDGDQVAFAYNLRFPGQYFDAKAGLSYNYFREYDAVTGRYVQSDPIGLNGGINTYAYALSNPVAYTDPLGLDVLLCKRPADLPFPMNLFKHYWIKTDKYESGMGGECDVPGQGCADRPYSATVTKDHTGQSEAENSSCEVMNNVDEACVNDIIAPGQPTGPWHLFNQCQNFALSAINRCRTGRQMSPAPTAPGVELPSLIRND